MARVSGTHSHKFSIADRDAVEALLKKMATPRGSRSVDEGRLFKALDSASQRYTQSNQQVRQAFFHGLLTGYAVGLKRK